MDGRQVREDPLGGTHRKRGSDSGCGGEHRWPAGGTRHEGRPSEAEPFWTEFLRRFKRRGLRGVKLVISDSHGSESRCDQGAEGHSQRCRVHFMRNALAHAGKTQRRMVSAAIATAFAKETAGAAHQQWRCVADQMRGEAAELAALMDSAEHDVLAFMHFPTR